MKKFLLLKIGSSRFVNSKLFTVFWVYGHRLFIICSQNAHKSCDSGAGLPTHRVRSLQAFCGKTTLLSLSKSRWKDLVWVLVLYTSVSGDCFTNFALRFWKWHESVCVSKDL